MVSPEKMSALLQKMREMSAGDISVLEAGVPVADASLMTMPGSANDALWSEMEKLGWMTSRPHANTVHDVTVHTKIYTIAEEGRDPIARLVQEYLKERVHQRMTDIANGFCIEFLTQLNTKVIQAGGSKQDVHIIMGMTVGRLIGATIEKQWRESALDDLILVARGLLKGRS